MARIDCFWYRTRSRHDLSYAARDFGLTINPQGCLLVALYLAEGRNYLIVGNGESGYIVVPDSVELRSELESRCSAVG
jgi:hypothetical protein